MTLEEKRSRLGEILRGYGRAAVALPGGTDSSYLCQAAREELGDGAIAVTMVTPVDFHTPDNLLTHLIRHVDVDLLVDTLGNLPGQMLNFAFVSLSPFRLAGQKYVDVVDVLDDAHIGRNLVGAAKGIGHY